MGKIQALVGLWKSTNCLLLFLPKIRVDLGQFDGEVSRTRLLVSISIIALFDKTEK